MKRSKPAPHVYVHYHTYNTQANPCITLLSPVLHGCRPSGGTLPLKHAGSMTRAIASTQHNSNSAPPPSPETYKHYIHRSPQHSHPCAPQRCSMQPINQPTMPACTVSAAVTPGLTLTRSRCPPTSVCLMQTLLVVVNFAWEPQAPTQASRPRLVTVVNTCKAATSIMR